MNVPIIKSIRETLEPMQLAKVAEAAVAAAAAADLIQQKLSPAIRVGGGSSLDNGGAAGYYATHMTPLHTRPNLLEQKGYASRVESHHPIHPKPYYSVFFFFFFICSP